MVFVAVELLALLAHAAGHFGPAVLGPVGQPLLDQFERLDIVGRGEPAGTIEREKGIEPPGAYWQGGAPVAAAAPAASSKSFPLSGYSVPTRVLVFLGAPRPEHQNLAGLNGVMFDGMVHYMLTPDGHATGHSDRGYRTIPLQQLLDEIADTQRKPPH